MIKFLRQLQEVILLYRTDQPNSEETNLYSTSVVLVNRNYYQTPYSEPLKDLVNYTVTGIMESCAQCHYN